MSEEYSVEIVNPEKSFLSKNDVTEVVVPAFEGEIGILKDHISIISFLKPGIIKIFSKSGEESFYVNDGIIEFKDNNLSILTSLILNLKDIDKEKISEIRKSAEEQLNKTDINDHEKYLLDLDKEDLDEIYWLAASWALLISISQDDPKMLAELPKIGLLIDRAIQINENYENGSFYDVKFSYDLARPDISDEIAIQSYEKAIELANGSRASLYLSYAESISLKNQNKTEFLKLINQVLTYDTEKYPNQRLSLIHI